MLGKIYIILKVLLLFFGAHFCRTLSQDGHKLWNPIENIYYAKIPFSMCCIAASSLTFVTLNGLIIF